MNIIDKLFLCAATTVSEIEDAFTNFSKRDDIAIILINQNVRGGHFLLVLLFTASHIYTSTLKFSKTIKSYLSIFNDMRAG